MSDTPKEVGAFIDRWEKSGAAERDVTFHHGDGSTSTGQIDLYKRGHFVLEAKQGADPLEPVKKLKKGIIDLPDAEILERLIALNTTRAAEEAQGHIRWLRPEFQCPESIEVQGEFPSTDTRSRIGSTGVGVAPVQDRGAAAKKPAWPKTRPDQVRELRDALSAAVGPVIAKLKRFQ